MLEKTWGKEKKWNKPNNNIQNIPQQNKTQENKCKNQTTEKRKKKEEKRKSQKYSHLYLLKIFLFIYT